MSSTANTAKRPLSGSRAEPGRLAVSLFVSLLAHALLFSLAFGDAESGLPGLGLPWHERRIDAARLRAELLPASDATALPHTPEHVSYARTRTAALGAARPTVKQSASSAPIVDATAGATEQAIAAVPAATQASDIAAAVSRAAPSQSVVQTAPPVLADPPAQDAPPLEAGDSADAPASTPVIALAADASRSQDEVPAARAAHEQVQAGAVPQTASPAPQAPGVEPAEPGALRPANPVEAAQGAFDRPETGREVPHRHASERQYSAPRHAEPRADAGLHNARRTPDAAAVPAQTASGGVERAQAPLPPAAREEPARLDATGGQARVDEEAAREARLRAIGRQLDEEAARRAAATTPAQALLPESLSTARRVRLWGRVHPNEELLEYAEAWASKIQLNTAPEAIREVAARPHARPLVTVAIRSDGSIESVTFEISSGVAEVDDAVRRILESHKPYARFPPALAREFDVIEIRRTWQFDTAVRLY